MLAVSFIGKKFTCDAHFEVADEIEGDGLKLNLKVRETCGQYLKPPGPVLATLHVNVNNGRRNDVTKCKELLMFLKEQVLPKTLKLINLKTIKKVKDEEKNEGVNLLSCIWPGKTKKRKDESKTSCSRGYSSDTESYAQKSVGRSNISTIDGTHQASNAGILATPMISNPKPKLLRRIKLKTNVDDTGDKQKNSATKKIQDENVTLNHCPKISQVKRIPQEKRGNDVKIPHNNLATPLDTNAKSGNFAEVGYRNTEALSTSKDQPKPEQDKVWHRRDIGMHRVQNEQPDWNSCNDISAGSTFDGFCVLNKSKRRIAKSSTVVESTSSREHGDLKVAHSSELKLQGKSNCLPTQEVAENNRGCVLELCGVQKCKLEIFAAEYVGKICETALSSKVKEMFEEFARRFVANVISLVKLKIIECEQSLAQRENVNFEEEDNMGGTVTSEESPSFSKVWKYSQIFAAEHEIPESLKVKGCRLKDRELDTCSKLRQKEDAQVINDFQFDEFENEVVGSPMSSNNSLSATSSDSSSHSMEFYKLHTKTESFSTYDLDNEQNTEEIPVEGEEESNKKKSEKRNDIEDAVSINNLASIPNLEETRHEIETDSKNSNCSQDDDNDFCNKENAEDDETAKAEGNTISSNGEKMQPGTKEAGKLAAKKQKHEGKTEPSYRRRALYKRTVSESQASERKQWCSTEPGDEDLQTTFHRFHSSCRPDTTAPKFVRSTSCPVVSEDDVLIESMLSHHEDVYDSLAKRTWIIVHVHELWNDGKPMDAIKTCIELTGMADVEKDLGTTSKLSSPYTLVSRDYALFLNVLQQLPSSCSMWTLDLCVLVLPKLKGFISTQHHTSHVEMACSIVHVVLKKVAVVVRRTSKGSKNKDKEQKVKFCTAELKDIKDRTSDVIQAVKSGKKNTTEDPGSMKSVLKELQLALETFPGSATTTS